MARTIILLGVLLAAAPATSYADWTLKPFAGVTFASSHGFVDLDDVAGVQPTFGGAVGWDWARLGVEAELATAPRFFKGASGLVESGRLDTFFVNASWRLTPSDAPLQPYLTFGVGAARVTIDDALDAFTSTSVLVAGDLGAGVGFPAAHTAARSWRRPDGAAVAASPSRRRRAFGTTRGEGDASAA